MTHRLVNNAATIMSYDAENRLVQVSGATTATFVYNGDGERVKSTVNGATTAFIGNILEWTGSTTTMKRYYYAGATRVAMRTGSTLSYILGDHLGSASVTTDANGIQVSETLYKPWGEVRYSSGTLPTKYTFTGQYSNVSDFGLMYYNARFYDPLLSRFTSADTLIPEPGNPQSWDRYSYSSNNPVNYTDPSGHCAISASSMIPGVGLFVSYASCVQDMVDAYNAYQSGETRPGVLYMEATGIKDALVTTANAVHQMNSDVSTVFSDAPLKERILPSVRVGTFAVGTAATIVGLPTGQTIAKAVKNPVKTSGEGILINKKAGDAFRDEIAELFTQAGYSVEKEVVKKTPFGSRRIDIEVTSPEGNLLGGIEAKLGSSRYLASQRAKDYWLLMQGYIVNVVRK